MHIWNGAFLSSKWIIYTPRSLEQTNNREKKWKFSFSTIPFLGPTNKRLPSSVIYPFWIKTSNEHQQQQPKERMLTTLLLVCTYKKNCKVPLPPNVTINISFDFFFHQQKGQIGQNECMQPKKNRNANHKMVHNATKKKICKWNTNFKF